MPKTQIIIYNLSDSDLTENQDQSFSKLLKAAVFTYVQNQHFAETPTWTVLPSLQRIIVSFESPETCEDVFLFIKSHYKSYHPTNPEGVNVEAMKPRFDTSKPETSLRVETYFEAEDEKRNIITRLRSASLEEGSLKNSEYSPMEQYREPTPETNEEDKKIEKEEDNGTPTFLFTPTEPSFSNRPVSPSITIDRFE
ncbi:unnamed protein product [Kuraishia capsulata CBS 1993]|uniref:Uncharacterized protein n=1 Tax=Kuraishia capsulata CBS 1993 TaxID=1382522 RepID=W6MSY9_9ASCO|nr:uncharacterized protein KUCA_T00005471001 [Kuraishia capsulata CBS 1993]CDK29483.1 unnamed protein product [Kuraishia capsulata CBS 1993]